MKRMPSVKMVPALVSCLLLAGLVTDRLPERHLRGDEKPAEASSKTKTPRVEKKTGLHAGQEG